MKIIRRLGVSPRQRGSVGNGTCPDFFELSDGRFAVIGTDLTEEIRSLLPPDAIRHRDRIVVVTRDTMLAAKRDIPDA